MNEREALIAAREAAKTFAKQHAAELAQNLNEWQDTGLLPSACRLRELHEICRPLGNRDTLALAEGFANRACRDYAARAAEATQPAAADPLLGATAWLCAAITDCRTSDIAGRLLIGYNRAFRLIEAVNASQAPAGVEAAQQGQEALIVDVFRIDGDDPFICAVRGKATIDVLTQIEADIREHADFGKGEGIYRFEPTWYAGQFDEYGRCELRPGWELEEVGFEAFPQESNPQEGHSDASR